MDTIISFVGSIAPNAFAPIRREVSYLIRYERNFTKLSGSVCDLQALGEEIKHRVEAERRNGKIIEVVVQNWLVEVNEVIERANQLLEDPRRREVGCSGWSFPNLILRHKLGKKATKIANDVVEVKGRRSDFNEVGYLPALYEIASSSATCVGEKFETRELFKEGILKALKDPKACNIGVYGFGGVGKTFLVNEVADIAKQQKLFDAVVIAHVSKTPDIKKIQVVIADMLGLTFPEESTDARAIRLRQRIEAEKSVLVILDDIWQPLDLEKVGIPSNKEHIGCKLLMTSRTQDVLQQMAVQKDLITFRLEVLSEVETWSLFQSMAGGVVKDISFKDVATQIAKQCKGLPLLIRTMATGLKSKNISAWKDALSRLQSVVDAEMDVIVHSVLELSYNWLASDEIQALFLLSAVLGDFDNTEDYLLKVTMGLDIFKNISTVDAARNRLQSIIESLKASCMILEGNKRSRRIQMHDLVRDVGISIACRNKDVYMLKPKTGLKEYLTVDFPKMCSQIILDNCLLQELPKTLDCPNLELFVLYSENRSLEIPDTIFDGIGSLKVLDLTLLNLSSLPTCFCSLTGLQTLCLDQCILGNMDIIGDLKNLKILSLLKSSMMKLPSQIREMTQLRMLDLSNSGIEVIPSNIISSLSNLEELYMGNISIKWEDENSVEQKENDILAELQQLYNLTALEFQIHKARPLPNLNSMFEKLQRYKIAIGDVWEWSDINDTTLKTLMLKLDTSIHSELGIKALIKGVENLYMDEVDGIQNVLYEMNGEGFPLLRHLHIQNNTKIKHIVYSMERNQVYVSFPILETLSINNLENLEQICHGLPDINSFGKLSVIKAKNCAQLTYLLSLSMVKSLSNLSEIEVCECNSMKNIVLGDLPDEKVEFRSLCSLTLQHLDTLDNFFSYELMTSSITSPRPFFSAQVAFPDLTTLKLSSLNLDKIWNDNQHSMYNLSVLIVENCGELKYLFSSTMVETFVNLKRVEISKCNSMNEIIATERRNDVTIALNEVPFPKLETIVVKDMENLKTVWHYQFDTVKTLEVENCEKIVVVFPSSMQKTCHNLEMLVVKDCALVELIFELSSSENSSIESETQLKVINLAQLPKLKKIWSRDPEGILSFHNLQNVDLNKCDSMEYVFPFSVATGCRHLEKLHIKWCLEIKEIVSEKTGSTCASPTFEFNKLNTILLDGLHSLKGFYAGNHILRCPSLRRLNVLECAQLNLFLKDVKKDNLSDLFQPLFIVEEVIPNLEWMTINDRDAMVILKSQNLDSLFNKLTFLALSDYKNDEATFPYWFLQNARSLEHLVVLDSSFKKIFEDERLVSMKIHTCLKKLWLFRLPKLQHICEDGSRIHPLLEHLEVLFIHDCPSLTNLLLPSSVNFSHLTYLEITKCNKLVNLISSSTAQSLVKLTVLKVQNCDSLQEIITGKENVDIAFVSLKRLMLKGLPSLNNFCLSKCFLKFPLLEYVVVSNCPVMEIFSEGNTSTPSLRNVKIEENVEECYWKGNLNDTIKKMFEDKSLS
ncbi:disease resistance protein At4g27190-like [Trifolium pratense]|uniref:disease resistance protein At4g27190-like n=1 Tax=Trifolium pratense TaxID=57577 RepID=UPI001E6941B4|nr:disease resistance protein At4g27190-like [Trifolium pratense]